jgi:ATP-binding cassette subfamily B protein RaxB
MIRRSGFRRLSLAEVSKHFTGIALELSPTSQFKPADERRRIRLGDLLGRVDGLRRSLAQVFVLALALQAIAIVSPFYMQVGRGRRRRLFRPGPPHRARARFLMLAAIQVGLSIMRSWVVLYLGTTLNLQWLANVFSHLLRLPVSYFEKRHLVTSCRALRRRQHDPANVTSSFVEAAHRRGHGGGGRSPMMARYSAGPSPGVAGVAAVRLYGGVLRLRRSTSRFSARPRSTSSTPPSSRAISSRRSGVVQSDQGSSGPDRSRRSRWLKPRGRCR